MGNAIINLVAVLVGAAASVVGSIIVNRRERRAEVRQRLYTDLVPEAILRMQEIPKGDQVDMDLLKRLWIIGHFVVVAGRGCRDVDRAMASYLLWRIRFDSEDEQDRAEAREDLKESLQALDELTDWLHKKLD